jgi:hypothetical protein
MGKNMKLCWILSVVVLTIAVMVVPRSGLAQDTRSLVPYPRDITVEAVDPETKMPRSSFCIGLNTLDVKLTNNSGYRRSVYLVNRDTRGVERTLYSGWLETGQQYLSTLIQARLEVTGPAGTEALRVDVSEYGRVTPGAWMTFYVQDCGGGYPPPGGGYAYVWARIYPYAIPQGAKGTITLQTSVESRANAMYYFEILNSYGQFWKRFPVSKRPYESYQVVLNVGKTTKPAMLTYTVNLWLESSAGGERQKVATTNFSFRVVTPGTSSSPYEQPWYPGEQQGSPYAPGNSWPPAWNPYGGMMPYSGMPYDQGSPYMMSPYGTTPYGPQYNVQGQQDRSIE